MDQNYMIKVSLIYALCSGLFLMIGLPRTVSGQDGSYLLRLEQDMRRLVEKVKPTVVTVSAQVSLSDLFLDHDPDNAFSEHNAVVITNVGSGIIFDSIHVVTHASVIRDSRNITITLANGQEIPVTLAGADNELGLAVLRSSTRLKQVAIFTPHRTVTPGGYVAIVGNALGISSAVSWGTINAVRGDGMIQIAANIPAGNLGGPVFDSSGHLLGLLAGLITSGSNPFESSLAGDAALVYPIDEIASRTRIILGTRNREEGWMGVTAEDWPGQRGWVHISNVSPGSPAFEAGLQMGDIIVTANGHRLHSSLELAQSVRRFNPGHTMHLGVLRGDSSLYCNVKIGAPSPEEASHKQASAPARSFIGTSRKAVTPELSKEQQKQLMRRIESLERELNDLRATLRQSR